MSFKHAIKVLHLDASARGLSLSTSRKLSNHLVMGLKTKFGADVVTRDLARGDLPIVNEPMAQGFFAKEKTPEMLKALELSDSLVKELQACDLIVLGTPMYNFGTPASLKIYADLVARAGMTFKYTESGPVGLLNKRAIVTVSSGGTAIGSQVDFLTPWLKFYLNFIGVSDVTLVDGTKGQLEAGKKHIDELLQK